MTPRKIIVTTEDHRRLEALLTSEAARLIGGSDRVDELNAELVKAQIVSPETVPADVVTMNSTVALRDLDTDEIETYTLVYPDRADIANYKLSVLAPIGTAVLGYRVGDEFHWQVPEGLRKLRVEQIVFQPEREGAFHL
jgi:regulator of nucleoside diphosphate kinase